MFQLLTGPLATRPEHRGKGALVWGASGQALTNNTEIPPVVALSLALARRKTMRLVRFIVNL